MKKTLSLLAIAALAVGAPIPSAAKDVVVKPAFPIGANGYYDNESAQYGSKITPSGTVVNTESGNSVTWDEADDVDVIEAPFNKDEGIAFTALTLSLDDVAVSEGDRLVLDFTEVTGKYQPQAWGMYLSMDYTGNFTNPSSGNVESGNVDYLMITIKGVNFANWYKEHPIEIVGRFYSDWNGSTIESTAYVITDYCDVASEGGVVFYSEDVIEAVEAAEVPPMVPEPATATLSLLALAGLAARRRRK